MIPIPNLPTDSLYKFLFVGGIALMIASTYFENNLNESFNKFILNVKSKNILLESELRKDIIEADKVSQIIDYQNRISNANSNIIEIKQISNELDSILRINKSIGERLSNREVDHKLRDLQIDAKNVEYKLNIRFYDNIFCLGVFINLIGSIFWYIYLQKPQDRMTKIQLELMEIELKKAKETPQVAIKYPKSNPPFYKRK